MTSSIRIGQDARKRLLYGARLFAKTLRVTYGPQGCTVMLDRPAGLLSTKDGMTVAREITLEDKEVNLGAQVLKQACLAVTEKVGDGSTTTAILAAEILRLGDKMVTAGNSPMGIVFGIRDACQEVCDHLKDRAVSTKDEETLRQVAWAASNGDDEIANLLAKAALAVGKDGTIIIEDGLGVGSELVIKDGMELNQGPVSPLFFDGPTLDRTIEGALVAVINGPLTSLTDVQDLLETASQWPQSELIVFADHIVGEALAAMTLNFSKKVVLSCGIAAPGYGPTRTEYLKDICALTGAVLVDSAAGMTHQKWNPEWFGKVRKATITKDKTVLEAYPECHEHIIKRLKELRAEEGTLSSQYDKDRLRERKAKLSGGLGLLKIGGVSEAAMKERRARVEDALGAVRAALKGGVLPGAGIPYFWGSLLLQKFDVECSTGEFLVGWGIVARALGKPLRVLVDNADASPTIPEQIKDAQKESPWTGWDAKTGELKDMRLAPRVMDPTLVVVGAIQAAVSVATTLLTVETTIVLSGKGS